jgi:DNA polymerase III epsilon subunit-like protein
MTTISINAPVRRRFVLTFDVETTGLIPKQSRNALHPIPITEYPYIIQFSFILYDIIDKQLVQMYDSYIKIPDLVPIPEVVSELTGIYKLTCQNRGRNIIDALTAFTEAYKSCDCLVAHNMDFDQEMILIELERNRAEITSRSPHCFTLFNPVFERVRNIDKYCTMKKGTDICNIVVSDQGKPPRKKWPKLSELYACLFNGAEVKNLHNSIVDVKACLKCYLKMRHFEDSENIHF